jgi:hypothetical protein
MSSRAKTGGTAKWAMAVPAFSVLVRCGGDTEVSGGVPALGGQATAMASGGSAESTSCRAWKPRASPRTRAPEDFDLPSQRGWDLAAAGPSVRSRAGPAVKNGSEPSVTPSAFLAAATSPVAHGGWYRERTPDLPELVYNRFFIHQQRFTRVEPRRRVNRVLVRVCPDRDLFRGGNGHHHLRAISGHGTELEAELRKSSPTAKLDCRARTGPGPQTSTTGAQAATVH